MAINGVGSSMDAWSRAVHPHRIPWIKTIHGSIGAILIALGTLVFVGWQLEEIALVQIQATWPPVQANNALVFIACGIAILGLALERPAWAVIGSTVALLIAGLTGLQYVLSVDFGIDNLLFEPFTTTHASTPGRMSPGTTMTSLVGSIALMISIIARPSRWKLATLLVSSLGLISIAVLVQLAFAGDLSGAFWWRDLTLMPVPAAFGFGLVGSAVALRAWEDGARTEQALPAWSSWAPGAMLALLSVMLWQSLEGREEILLEGMTRTESKIVQDSIHELVESRTSSLVRMAERWKRRGGVPFAEWMGDASNLANDLSGFRAITLIKPDYGIQWLFPEEDAGQLRDFDFTSGVMHRMIFDAARVSRKAVLSPSFELILGGMGFVVAVPIFDGDRFDGIVAASFRHKELFGSLIEESATKGFALSIWHGNDEVLSSQTQTAELGRAIGFSVQIRTTTFHGSVRPILGNNPDELSILPEIILVVGLLGSVLLVAALISLRSARLRAVEVARANRRLLVEMEARRHAQGQLEALNESLETRVAERTFALASEVAERKRAEERIAEQEKNYRDLFENAPVPMVSLTLDGEYIQTNRAYREIVGYSLEELAHMRPIDVVHPKDRGEVVRKTMAAMLDPEGRITGEFRLLAKGGQTIWVLLSANVIRDARGEPHHIVSHTQDITARKMAEEQLFQSQKMEALGNLAGGIAHDFNNMLLPIIALTEISQQDLPKGSPVRENLQSVLEAANQASQLVQQILTFSRQNEHEMVDVDISQCTAEALSLLRNVLPASITIHGEIEPDLGIVAADHAQLISVIMNLGSNAVDAMEGKVGILSVGLSRLTATLDLAARLPAVLEGHSYARIVVEDSGCGMDRATLEKIFNPFFTTKPVGEGTGLGLAMVHGIVEGFEGAIDVTSEVDVGTTFEIYLPLKAATGRSEIRGDIGRVVAA